MASLSSNTRHDERHGGLAKDSFAVMAVVHAGPDSRSTRYPARAPREKGDLAPRVEIRRRARQVQDEAADGADHVDAEFEQPIAQPQHLGSGTRGARRAQPQFLHERIAR